MTDGWDAGGWAGARQAQEDAWLTTTPEQRLAWLEEAIAFVRTSARATRHGRELESPPEVTHPQP